MPKTSLCYIQEVKQGMISPSYIPPQGVSECAGKVGEDRSKNLPCAFSAHLPLRRSAVVWFFSPDVFVEDCGSGYLLPQLPAASSGDKEASQQPREKQCPRILLHMSSCGLRDGSPA